MIPRECVNQEQLFEFVKHILEADILVPVYHGKHPTMSNVGCVVSLTSVSKVCEQGIGTYYKAVIRLSTFLDTEMMFIADVYWYSHRDMVVEVQHTRSGILSRAYGHNLVMTERFVKNETSVIMSNLFQPFLDFVWAPASHIAPVASETFVTTDWDLI